VLLYRPERIDAPAPLVVMMHGGFGNAQQAENSYGWDEQADKSGFIVAYPDGTSRAWNAGTCCGLPAATHVDDVGFVVDAVESLEAEARRAPSGTATTTTFGKGFASAPYTIALSFAACAPVTWARHASIARRHPSAIISSCR
jgi:polyhydroxybutyrate depolymerase